MSRKRHPTSQKKLFPRIKRLLEWTKTRQRLVGIWLFLIGFLLVTFPTVYRIAIGAYTSAPTNATNIIRIASDTIKATTSVKTIDQKEPIHVDQKLLGETVPSQPPLRILVPSYKVNLSVVEAKVVSGYWELSENSASHSVGSANPGEAGNVVVFAHARTDLFGPLRDIKRDDDIYILTKDRWYRYRVTETKLVDPSAIETIAQTKDETLTLFTCSGFLDSKRLIATAKPLNP